jgi:restriction system protein
MARRPKRDPVFFPPEVDCPFVGRGTELEWLERETHERERGYAGMPIVVTGEPGIGKTTLVSEFAGRLGGPDRPIWISARDVNERNDAFEKAIRSTIGDREVRRVVPIFDGADEIPREQLIHEWGRLTNYKLVRTVIFTSRTELGLRGERVLKLERLQRGDAESLVKQRLSSSLLEDGSMEKLLSVVHGHPLAINLLADMAQAMDPEQLRKVLEGHLYDLKDAGAEAQRELITVAKPIIISANDAMIAALKKQPKDVLKLSPREYEELISELLDDMGYDVTLTQATRDGGKDIVASIKTECGEFLCLVEAKKYREDRKIGVSLVRTLYGTLCDYQANSGMLVTTSTYSKDAQAFQKRHQYQLSLRDYADVAGWIQKYGTYKAR